MSGVNCQAQAPVITKVSTWSGSPGTPFTLWGSNLDDPVSVQIGETDALFFFGGYDVDGATAYVSVLVPYQAGGGRITVRTPDGSYTSAARFEVVARPAPVIERFAPEFGGPGQEVVLHGSNLTDVVSVEFNGTPALESAYGMFGLWYYVTVPAGATSGPIRIKTRTGAFTTTAHFEVTPPPYRPPWIREFSPLSGPPGTLVGFMGSNLLEILSVQFNGVEAPWSGAGFAGGIYTATVPTNATTGPITIQNLSDSYTTATSFTVTGFPPPVITGFDPSSAAPGAIVTIHGSSLLRATEVLFDGVPAKFERSPMPPIDPRDVWPLHATVPTSARSGLITVIAPEGTSVSSESFTVLPSPSLAGFDVEAGAPGAVIEIYGAHLDQVTSVTLGDTPAPFSQSVARLHFTVPAQAQTAPVTVTTRAGAVTSNQSFVVLRLGDSLEHWAWQGKLGANFNAIAYGAGRFVAVGYDYIRGGITSSEDGSTWKPHYLPLQEYDTWHDIVYGDNLFVAVGRTGRIITSPDGITWTRQTSGVEYFWGDYTGIGVLTKVTYGQGQFVAVGERGLIITSEDGRTWTKRAADNTEHLTAVTFGHGLFVAGGFSSTMLVSTDGARWQRVEVEPPFAFLSDLEFADETFVGVGNGYIMTSKDGRDWTRQNTAEPCFLFLRAVAFGAGKFVAVSQNQGRTVFSPRGGDWVCGQMPTREVVHGLAYGAGRFVAVGSGGALLTSADGEVWRAEAAGNASSLLDVTFGAAGFVAVGSAKNHRIPRAGRSIFISRAGDSWAEANPLGSPEDSELLTGLVFDGKNYLAIGGHRGTSVQNSADGVSWLARTAPPLGSAIAFGKGTYVSVGVAEMRGQATIARSTDGLNWSFLPPPTAQSLTSVACGEDRWVAVGHEGTILTSSDSIVWRQVSSGTTLDLYGVAWGGARFIAVGGNGVILSSLDGDAWTLSMPGDGRSLYDVAYGDGNYVAVGANGSIVTSSGAMDWQRRNAGTIPDLFGVAYGNRTFVVVGDHGAVLQSVSAKLPLRFTSWHASPAALQLRLIDEAGKFFRVQTSSNLVDWTDLSVATRQQHGLWFIDAPRSAVPHCFYRAVLIPDLLNPE